MKESRGFIGIIFWIIIIFLVVSGAILYYIIQKTSFWDNRNPEKINNSQIGEIETIEFYEDVNPPQNNERGEILMEEIYK